MVKTIQNYENCENGEKPSETVKNFEKLWKMVEAVKTDTNCEKRWNCLKNSGKNWKTLKKLWGKACDKNVKKVGEMLEKTVKKRWETVENGETV